MGWVMFQRADFATVGEALDIAEDVTGDYFKLSTAQWKRHRYDVKTFRSLKREEISEHAFALLQKGAVGAENGQPGSRGRDIYFICLQDHRILKALGRDRNLALLPLMVYVFTHELIHIVRFCNFFQRFDASEEARESEERIVHEATYHALDKVPLPRLDYVLDLYRGHRICEVACA